MNPTDHDPAHEASSIEEANEELNRVLPIGEVRELFDYIEWDEEVA